MKYRCSKN